MPMGATKSRQFEHLQEQSLKQLKAMVPEECPLVVRRLPSSGFVVTVDGIEDVSVGLAGRYQVIASWIDGYVTAWRRGREAFLRRSHV